MTRGIYKRTKEYKIKHSQDCKGKSGVYVRTEETKEKMRGRTPWNKDTVGVMKANSGSFKKGDNVGAKHPNWKGGKIIRQDDYVCIYQPTHPFSTKQGYVLEHRLVMEKHLGRYLEPKEVVHHINEITNDNRIENFILFKNRPYHRWFHKRGYCNPKGIIFDGRHL